MKVKKEELISKKPIPLIIHECDFYDDDDFDEEYICINKTYFGRLKYNKICNEHKLAETALSLGIFFKSDNKPYLYNKNSCFNSLLHLGELLNLEIKNKYNIININNLSTADMMKELYENYLQPWLDLNVYPYYNEKIYYLDFLLDCLYLYLLYDIHKWIIKLNKINTYIDDEMVAREESKEIIDIIIQKLKYINMKDFIINKYGFNLRYIYGLPIVDNIDNELIYLDNLFNNRLTFNSIDEQNNFIDYVTKYLIECAKERTRERIDFTITKNFIYYNINSKQYRILETSFSVIAVAYDKLLLHLTSTELDYKREICHAKNCNNEFVKNSNRKIYCDNIECKKRRNTSKCRKFYETNTKPKREKLKNKKHIA